MTSPLRLIFLTALLAVPLQTAQGEDLKRDEAGAMAAANNAFAWDLYGALRGGTDNLFFSPYSITMALTLARHGAKGETAAEIDEVMHFPKERFADQHFFWAKGLEPPLVRARVDGEPDDGSVALPRVELPAVGPALVRSRVHLQQPEHPVGGDVEGRDVAQPGAELAAAAPAVDLVADVVVGHRLHGSCGALRCARAAGAQRQRQQHGQPGDGRPRIGDSRHTHPLPSPLHLL